MVGSRLSICPPSARALRRCRSKNLAVGSMERARHRLLEGNAAGIFQAVRLQRGRGPARASRGSHRRPGQHRPGNPKAAEFLRSFLDHCAHQPNYVSGKIGSRLDFISFHPKGSPKWQGDHVQMGIARQLAAIEQGFQIVASFPEWRRTADHSGRIGPGRMRRLLGAQQSAELLSQRTVVRRLHG